VLLAATRWWQRRDGAAGRTPSTHPAVIWAKRFGTFHVVCFGWLLFRATSIDQVAAALGRFGDWGFFGRVYLPPAAALALAVGGLAHLVPPRWAGRLAESFTRWPAPAQAAACCAVVWAAVLIANVVSPFIYFQF
jgi:hypothetical protein